MDMGTRKGRDHTHPNLAPSRGKGEEGEGECRAEDAMWFERGTGGSRTAPTRGAEGWIPAPVSGHEDRLLAGVTEGGWDEDGSPPARGQEGGEFTPIHRLHEGRL